MIGKTLIKRIAEEVKKEQKDGLDDIELQLMLQVVTRSSRKLGLITERN